MSIKATFRNGVFELLEKVDGASTGQMYTVFSEAEIRDLHELLGWLKAAEGAFDFWNADDAIYDKL